MGQRTAYSAPCNRRNLVVDVAGRRAGKREICIRTRIKRVCEHMERSRNGQKRVIDAPDGHIATLA